MDFLPNVSVNDIIVHHNDKNNCKELKDFLENNTIRDNSIIKQGWDNWLRHLIEVMG